MGYGANNGTVCSSEIPELLRVLELEALPDPAGLESQFKDLIKRYHPDRNRQREAWANERSRAVLYAARRLRSYLETRVVPEAVRQAAPEVRTRPRRTSAENRPRSPRTQEAPREAGGATPFRRTNSHALPFQLIEWQDSGFALPIPNIVRILGPGDASIRRDARASFCYYNREIYPLQTVRPHPGAPAPDWNECGYVILLRSERERSALVLHREARFASIELISLLEIRRVNAHAAELEPFLWAPHGRRFYLCPGAFLRERLQTNFAGV